MNEYEYMIIKICEAYSQTSITSDELCNAILAIIKTKNYENIKNDQRA